MPHIDIRIEVTTEHDEFDGTPYHDVTGLSRLDTDLDHNSIVGIQEGLVQSDFGQVNFHNGVLDVLTKEKVDLKR